MTNKERFLALVATEDTTTLARIEERIQNREMLRAAQRIALTVLERMDDLNWSKEQLAEKMGVSRQLISEIVSGQKDLSLSTRVKLESVLNTSILPK